MAVSNSDAIRARVKKNDEMFKRMARTTCYASAQTHSHVRLPLADQGTSKQSIRPTNVAYSSLYVLQRAARV